METVLVFLGTLVFYVFYSTSRRAKLNYDYPYQKWINQNPDKGKKIGYICLSLFIIVCIGLNKLEGLFSFIMILMCMGCVIILAFPLKVFSFRVLMFIFIISFIIEYFI